MKKHNQNIKFSLIYENKYIHFAITLSLIKKTHTKKVWKLLHKFVAIVKNMNWLFLITFGFLFGILSMFLLRATTGCIFEDVRLGVPCESRRFSKFEDMSANWNKINSEELKLYYTKAIKTKKQTCFYIT